MSSPEALYVRDGDAFVGTEATLGSWYANAQAGGPLLALLGHLVEDIPAPAPMTLTRLTVDIVRPVPAGERLYVEPTIVREGTRIQLLDFVIRTADHVTTRARALRSIDQDILALGGRPRSSTTDVPALRLPAPATFASVENMPRVAAFLLLGAELLQSPGPINGQHALWIRLRVPVVAGEPVRATSRAVVGLDMVNLIGVDDAEIRDLQVINPDVSGHLLRQPVGEWVAMTGNSYYHHTTGHGMSTALLSDEDGVFGLTSTSQLVGS
jgi:hypothetical protein